MLQVIFVKHTIHIGHFEFARDIFRTSLALSVNRRTIDKSIVAGFEFRFGLGIYGVGKLFEFFGLFIKPYSCTYGIGFESSQLKTVKIIIECLVESQR